MSSGGSVEADPLLSTSPITTTYKPSQPQPIGETLVICSLCHVIPKCHVALLCHASSSTISHYVILELGTNKFLFEEKIILYLKVRLESNEPL